MCMYVCTLRTKLKLYPFANGAEPTASGLITMLFARVITIMDKFKMATLTLTTFKMATFKMATL